jgi:hypothetical protein
VSFNSLCDSVSTRFSCSVLNHQNNQTKLIRFSLSLVPTSGLVCDTLRTIGCVIPFSVVVNILSFVWEHEGLFICYLFILFIYFLLFLIFSLILLVILFVYFVFLLFCFIFNFNLILSLFIFIYFCYFQDSEWNAIRDLLLGSAKTINLSKRSKKQFIPDTDLEIALALTSSFKISAGQQQGEENNENKMRYISVFVLFI